MTSDRTEAHRFGLRPLQASGGVSKTRATHGRMPHHRTIERPADLTAKKSSLTTSAGPKAYARLRMQSSTDHPRPPSERSHDWMWAALMIGLALAAAVTVTAPLQVPPEIDHYRDMGTAEAFRAGQFGRDPTLLRETAWYPPLLPALLALTATSSSQPLTFVSVHIGPFINAAAPAFFFLLARRLFGGRAALLSLIGFLYIADWGGPPWTMATYSPWVWPVLFAQSLFYWSLRCWVVALQYPTRGKAALAGVSVGVTFLAHPAPALLLVVAIVATTIGHLMTRCRTPREHERWPHATLERLFIVGGITVLVCAPFLVPLLVRYGGHIRNPVPSRFGGIWPGEVLQSHLSLRTLGAAAGFGWLWSLRKQWASLAGWWVSLAAISLTAAAGLTYGIFAQKLEMRGIVIPLLFPTFHFHFYLQAMEALLFGPGVLWLVELGRRRIDLDAFSSKFGTISRCLPAVSLVLLFAISLPSYWKRSDFTRWPEESRRLAGDARLQAVYNWASASLKQGDVVLAGNRLGMYAVAASGHAIVATYPSMMNPYVALEPREAARAAMFADLRAGDFTHFNATARAFGVTHVIAEEMGDECCKLSGTETPLLRPVLTTTGATIYALQRD